MPSSNPRVLVDISWSKGTLANWSFRVYVVDGDGSATLRLGHSNITRVAIGHGEGGRTTVWVARNGVMPTTPDVEIRGFVKAMRKLSDLIGYEVEIVCNSYWNASPRAMDMRGVYGTYVPPIPPVVATIHPVAMLRAAYAEYHARVRGENSRTPLGFCQSGECSKVAASIETVEGRPLAVCKGHQPIHAEMVAAAVALVRANRKVYVQEAHNFGFGREIYAHAVRTGELILVKEGPYTRWEIAPVAADADESAAVMATSGRFRKHKSTSVTRRFRKGA